MTGSPAAVEELGRHLARLGWVVDLLVGGSLATGDYVPGVSDLDLVAVVNGGVDAARRSELATLHQSLDREVGSGMNLGCVYVAETSLLAVEFRHPTWTHGVMVERVLSQVSRAELVRHGYPVFGRVPLEVLPSVSDDDVRQAARVELTGYWASAVRRPLLWLNLTFVDLGLTSMARGRHALATGQLLTKTRALDQVDAPSWLIDQVRARRRGEMVASPRLRAAMIAWSDARRTTARARQ